MSEQVWFSDWGNLQTWEIGKPILSITCHFHCKCLWSDLPNRYQDSIFIIQRTFLMLANLGISWKLSLLKYDTVLQNINRISFSILADWIHYFFRSWFTSLHYHFKWHIKTMPAHRGGLPMGMYECY